MSQSYTAGGVGQTGALPVKAFCSGFTCREDLSHECLSISLDQMDGYD